MADYPSVRQRLGTAVTGAAGIRVMQTPSGRPVFSRFATQTWYAVKVYHECNKAAADSIYSHYTAHRMLEFNFTETATGKTYKCQYVQPPTITATPGVERYSVETVLVSTERSPFAVVKITASASVALVGEVTSKRKAVLVTAGSTTAATYGIGRTADPLVDVFADVLITKKTARSVTVTVSASSSVSATGTNP